jgi:hypothetical protein
MFYASQENRGYGLRNGCRFQRYVHAHRSTIKVMDQCMSACVHGKHSKNGREPPRMNRCFHIKLHAPRLKHVLVKLHELYI